MQNIPHRKPNIKAANQDGFTLLELTIVLVIIGILIVPLMALYKTYSENKIYLDTNSALGAANEALAAFVLANNRYPCPARPDRVIGDVDYGREDCGALNTFTVNNCPVEGFCYATDGAGREVYTGFLPFATLELEGQFAKDGYNNKLNYMITKSLTVNPGPGLNLPDNRHIVPLDELGNEKLPYRYAIISPGENKFGAYPINGAEVIVSCDVNRRITEGGEEMDPILADSEYSDAENCDEDLFMVDQLLRTDSFGNIFDSRGREFDDAVIADSAYTPDPWVSLPDVSDEDRLNGRIRNVNSGFVGIGFSPSDEGPQEMLDVNGTIRANQMNAEELCDQSGTNCIPVSLLGGPAEIALSCPDDQVLTGLADGNPRCSEIPITDIRNRSCPPGQFVVGITTSGDLVCQVVPE